LSLSYSRLASFRTPKFDGTGYPAETRNRYGLVARLTLRVDINPGRSEDGLFEQFAYGELPGNRYCAARGGHLWFTVNDNSPKDNSGATQVMELRSTMSITRRWVIKAPNVPGSYRLKLVYYNSPNTQTTPVTIYSPTCEVQ
jgi:hypothetical protein